MLGWKVSRHRHPFGFAIVQRSSVKGAAERRGIGPAAIRKEVVLPWTPMATLRKTRWFWPIGAGGTVNDTGYESISGNRISNCKHFGPNFNCLSSSTDRTHNPVRPMAAHQLGMDFGGAAAIRHRMASLTTADESHKPAPPNYRIKNA